MPLQKLKASDIRTDGGTQMREKISEPTVREYAALMRDGAEFPPPVVFFDGQYYWLADGFHRLEAFLTNERQSFQCDVREGSRRDAVLYSISANASHGLPMRHGDKRRAIETLLRDPEWCKWSNSAIASRVSCAVNTVHKIRRDLVKDGEIKPRESVTFVSRGQVVERRSNDCRDTSTDRPNFGRDWLRLLVNFTPAQFIQWRDTMSRHKNVDRHTAAEAVECVLTDEAARAA